LVERYEPPKESGIDFDLDSAQAANEAAAAESRVSAKEATTGGEEPAQKKSSNFFADDGLFMRFVWWTLRTACSFLIPLAMFYALIRNPQLVEGAYKMISPGVNPYPLLMKGGLANFMAFLIAIVPPLFGIWLGSVMSRIRSLKPFIAVWIWFIIMFFFTVMFVVLARYFRII